MASSFSFYSISPEDLAYILLSSSRAVIPRLLPPPQPPLPSYRLSLKDTRLVMQNFTHDQLLSILNAATLRSVNVVEAVHCIVDSDRTRRQLFVANLTLKPLPPLSFPSMSMSTKPLLFMIGLVSVGSLDLSLRNIRDALRARKHMNKRIDGHFIVTELKKPHQSDASGALDIMKRAFDLSNEAVERVHKEKQEMKKENKEFWSNLDKVLFALFVLLVYGAFLAMVVLGSSLFSSLM